MTSPTLSTNISGITLNILCLNCWGLKYISSHRKERLAEISRRIASASPLYDIVALQEFWVYSDYLNLRTITSSVLPYGKFYHSGVLGGGLVILSRYRIVESNMWQYVLNGRPTAFWRGDWYVGKGVAGAVIEIDGKDSVGTKKRIEVFCTHLHAPYEKGEDSYLCHRTAQAWQLSKLLRGSVQRGHIPVALGDFNMVPTSLAHRIITTHGLVSDAWLSKFPNTSSLPPLHASYNITTLGVTCDSILNTWRMPATLIDIPSHEASDPHAQRLDYVFHSSRVSKVVDVKVGMTDHFKLRGRYKEGKGVARGGMVSLSDHFSIEVKLKLLPSEPPNLISIGEESQEGQEEEYLSLEVLGEIQALSKKYVKREQWEYKWRIAHFWLSMIALVLLHVAVWWSTYAGVAFMIVVLSWVIAVTGVVNGLIGFLFMGSELNALKEFEEEIRMYRSIAEEKFANGQGRPRAPEAGAVDSGSIGERIHAETELERQAVDRRRVIMQ